MGGGQAQEDFEFVRLGKLTKNEIEAFRLEQQRPKNLSASIHVQPGSFTQREVISTKAAITIGKGRATNAPVTNQILSNDEKIRKIEQQIQYQQKSKKAELNKIRNLFTQMSGSYSNNQ